MVTRSNFPARPWYGLAAIMTRHVTIQDRPHVEGLADMSSPCSPSTVLSQVTSLPCGLRSRTHHNHVTGRRRAVVTLSVKCNTDVVVTRHVGSGPAEQAQYKSHCCSPEFQTALVSDQSDSLAPPDPEECLYSLRSRLPAPDPKGSIFASGDCLNLNVQLERENV